MWGWWWLIVSDKGSTPLMAKVRLQTHSLSSRVESQASRAGTESIAKPLTISSPRSRMTIAEHIPTVTQAPCAYSSHTSNPCRSADGLPRASFAIYERSDLHSAA